MSAGLRIRLNRAAGSSLSDQIRETIRAAVLEGRLAPGARLPSWRDLAAQLGVARGTVRVAYERLADELLIVASGPAGTHVAHRPRRARSTTIEIPAHLRDRAALYRAEHLPFQMGVPAHDGFPAVPWTRALVRAARADAAQAARYPDPCGVFELRAQIAGYLALARGIRCVPEQIVITRGYRDGLNLALRAVEAAGAAWMEDPGYFVTRAGLALAGLRTIPVPVDNHGLSVKQGVALAPDAAVAVVTAGQQAPLGVTLSNERRQSLLLWAQRSGAWIIEDDYLSELQLRGRAAPALMATERAARVIYVGTFSKTMSPSLGVGFVVAPPALAARFVEIAECLAPSQGTLVQLALAEFLRDGHYLRHLRRMKRLYAARRDALLARLAGMSGVEAMAGLAVLLRLPRGTDDVAIAERARRHGLALGVLSEWYATDRGRAHGLLLGVTNLVDASIERACARLRAVVTQQ